MRWPRPPFRSDRIYILPTGHGIAFLCSIVVMVLTAATYGNNMIYILSFLLFGVVLITMVQTNVNLKGVQVNRCHIPDAFAGEDILVHLNVQNSLHITRETLVVNVGDSKHSASLALLGALATEQVALKLPKQSRGRYVLKRVQISTVYPLGLFRSWKNVDLNQEYFVLPRPQGEQDISVASVDYGGGLTAARWSGGFQGADFREHRNFQSGDSFQHVDWKAYARNRPLLVKQFEGDLQRAYRFQMPAGRGEAVERALSQIAIWILGAETEGAAYELRQVGRTSTMNSGFHHCQTCLRQLAIYGLPTEEKGR